MVEILLHFGRKPKSKNTFIMQDSMRLHNVRNIRKKNVTSTPDEFSCNSTLSSIRILGILRDREISPMISVKEG